MKKFLTIAFIFLTFTSFSQTNWEPMYLTVSGYHMVEGVEGWYASGNCGGTDYIFIRFVNTNSYPVSISWYDGVFTQGQEWFFNDNPADRKNLELLSAEDKEGSCTGAAELRLEPYDIGIDASQFFRYKAMDLIIIK